MGAESDATWLIDKAGQESTYCCLNAVLRDYGRLGLVLANNGRVGDRQIIPAEWIAAATTAPSPYLAPWIATRFFGYGYQTWIFPETRGFALLGIRGQVVYVDPASKLVMAQTAVRPIEDPRGRETVALWYALRDVYGR
jgi:CubicO group peptidase (beta-lactamase class C family)